MQKLATAYGLKVPSDALTKHSVCSEFIDNLPPSEKQAEFVRTLADKRSIKLPAEVFSRRKACGDFIEACQQDFLRIKLKMSAWLLHIRLAMLATRGPGHLGMPRAAVQRWISRA